jgi:hypothetical protein
MALRLWELNGQAIAGPSGGTAPAGGEPREGDRPA